MRIQFHQCHVIIIIFKYLYFLIYFVNDYEIFLCQEINLVLREFKKKINDFDLMKSKNLWNRKRFMLIVKLSALNF